MKKKIEDLTLKECLKICQTNDECEKCPLYHILPIRKLNDYHIDCPIYPDDDGYLEREVEVDERIKL